MQKFKRNGWFTLLIFIFLGVNKGWAQNPALANQKGEHLVQKGDTYYGLSRLYQVPVDSLQRWNGTELKAGTTIRVKSLAAVAATEKVKSSPESLKTEKPVLPANVPAPSQTEATSQVNKAETTVLPDKAAQRVMVIPFDPALYFSDADNDIAWQSDMPKQKVRYAFRTQLNASLTAPGFETINMLQGSMPNEEELSRIYKAVTYSYQDITYSNFNPVPPPKEKGLKAWLKNTKSKVGLPAPETPVAVADDERKYYGVQLTDSAFFAALHQQYQSDYYLFVNQFEIFTDYTNCIDRTTQNFVRNFRVHYSIFDAKGEIIAGNKVLIPYVSNVNDINKIIKENLPKIANRILADLPRPQPVVEQSVAN